MEVEFLARAFVSKRFSRLMDARVEYWTMQASSLAV